ncbi:MAG: hypothetical protein JWL80_112 [Parcubacteria group bacterium]|nr:hypothetical protein [Parcubacteria group bacterium]
MSGIFLCYPYCMKSPRQLLSQRPFVIILIAFLLGISGTLVIKKYFVPRIAEPTSVRENSPEYKFVNPILYTKTDKGLYTEYAGLDKTISSFVEAQKEAGKASDISVYFRDANSGHWTGVNEDDIYDPGSMLKVAVLMGYVSDAELHPDILTRMYEYTPVTDPGQNYKPIPLPAGLYSARTLLSQMITQSDNTATEILVKNDPVAYNRVYQKLMLPSGPTSSSTEDFMSPHQYVALYQTLYNSTYLPSYLSDEVLHLLSNTTFSKGLKEGIPPDVALAHKFGEHTDIGPDGKVLYRELHDCGIIYYPEKPYMLCVMTKGNDFSSLEGVISGISRLVYEFVHS